MWVCVKRWREYTCVCVCGLNDEESVRVCVCVCVDRRRECTYMCVWSGVALHELLMHQGLADPTSCYIAKIADGFRSLWQPLLCWLSSRPSYNIWLICISLMLLLTGCTFICSSLLAFTMTSCLGSGYTHVVHTLPHTHTFLLTHARMHARALPLGSLCFVLETKPVKRFQSHI